MPSTVARGYCWPAALTGNLARLPCRAAAPQQGPALSRRPAHRRGDHRRHARRRRRRRRRETARVDRRALARWPTGQRGARAAESDLDASRGAMLVRHGKGGKRREVGMDRWAWGQLAAWLTLRSTLRSARCSAFCAARRAGGLGPRRRVRTQLHAAAARAGVQTALRAAPLCRRLRYAQFDASLAGIPGSRCVEVGITTTRPARFRGRVALTVHAEQPWNAVDKQERIADPRPAPASGRPSLCRFEPVQFVSVSKVFSRASA